MPGRSAEAMITAKKRSPRTSFSFHRARAMTTIEPATIVATAARRAVSLTATTFPGTPWLERAKGLYERTFGRYNGLLGGRRRARSPRRPGAQPQRHHRPT